MTALLRMKLEVVDQSALCLSMNDRIADITIFTLFEGVLPLFDVEFLTQAN